MDRLVGESASVSVAESGMEVPARFRHAPSLSEVQERILGIVREMPGATIQLVADRVHCAHATSSYHLETLARRGFVLRERDGRVVRHFCGPDEGPVESVRFEHFLRDDRTRTIIDVLVSAGTHKFTPNELAHRVSSYYGGVQRDLRRLAQDGLIALERRSECRQLVSATPKLVAMAAGR